MAGQARRVEDHFVCPVYLLFYYQNFNQMKNKIVQIETVPLGGGEPLLFALHEDGTIQVRLINPRRIEGLLDGSWKKLDPCQSEDLNKQDPNQQASKQ